jgi:hypothetical protein
VNSYNFTLKVDRGFISLQSTDGQIPDGTFDIAGYIDDNQETLGIHRREPDGRFAGSAHHAHPVRISAPVPEPAEGGF